MNQSTVDHEIYELAQGMKRFAQQQADGTYKTTFGTIFKDEKLEQILESLVQPKRSVFQMKHLNILLFLFARLAQ